MEEVGIDARLVKISVLIRHARPVRCGLLMTCATTMGSINWPNGHFMVVVTIPRSRFFEEFHESNCEREARILSPGKERS